MDSTNQALILNTMGGPIEVELSGSVSVDGQYHVHFNVELDGQVIAADDGIFGIYIAVANETFNTSFKRLISPHLHGLMPGSHTLVLQWKIDNGAGTATMFAGAGTANADTHPQFAVTEVED